ncbi:MAG: aminotransferase class I/II-fold pyridoxal phosphate-dependent enzyme, partial [Anaerolineales bacterium]|nr:aminotransferase class I/II-fold pyridoxal phosphate-dependent enzyme [Anaerolineales bacterium]
MEWIDLRSDTVTEPTPEMREAMANAEVGDDVYGEDPTVNHLQALSAKMLGKEAALFVPSGTMGNLAAILAHCDRGDEIIIGDRSHTYLYEAGGVSALGGIHTFVVENRDDGTVPYEEFEAAIRPDNDHFPITSLISLENSHNRCGGSVLSVDYTQEVARIAREHGLSMHIDGARIFNAAIALDVSPESLVASADSVTFCLSKGLCAPAGSVICGDEAFIQKAHRVRKMLGGGMR